MTETNRDLVEIDGVHFAYGQRGLLAGVNLHIRRGEVVGILGTSGSGKTTLLRLMTGQLKPARGTVRVAGRIVHQLDTASLYALRRDMGMMFQAGGLFSDMSVFDNIAFPLREHTGLSEDVIRDLVLMKLQAVGLRGARELMPMELSGGMARRVVLARGIAMDPMLILYDEPFAGLDPISLNVVANLIRRLNDALGATSVVVTYDVSESLKVVDRAFFISEGRIAAHGTPREMSASKDPFVRQFIHAQPDGPVPFHYPAQALASDFDLPCA
jgi:phospholipid/cholesterol/gamma-HCH transport system ATP-binding protein